MSYTVRIERQAAKFLRELTDQRLASRFRKAFDTLAKNPRPPGCLKLQGGNELYRVRVGDYRIVYQVQDDILVVLVVDVGNRRDIYR
jgi:mRNA interferase RelE/StbE